MEPPSKPLNVEYFDSSDPNLPAEIAQMRDTMDKILADYLASAYALAVEDGVFNTEIGSQAYNNAVSFWLAEALACHCLNGGFSTEHAAEYASGVLANIAYQFKQALAKYSDERLARLQSQAEKETKQ